MQKLKNHTSSTIPYKKKNKYLSLSQLKKESEEVCFKIEKIRNLYEAGFQIFGLTYCRNFKTEIYNTNLSYFCKFAMQPVTITSNLKSR